MRQLRGNSPDAPPRLMCPLPRPPRFAPRRDSTFADVAAPLSSPATLYKHLSRVCVVPFSTEAPCSETTGSGAYVGGAVPNTAAGKPISVPRVIRRCALGRFLRFSTFARFRLGCRFLGPLTPAALFEKIRPGNPKRSHDRPHQKPPFFGASSGDASSFSRMISTASFRISASCVLRPSMSKKHTSRSADCSRAPPRTRLSSGRCYAATLRQQAVLRHAAGCLNGNELLKCAAAFRAGGWGRFRTGPAGAATNQQGSATSSILLVICVVRGARGTRQMLTPRDSASSGKRSHD